MAEAGNTPPQHSLQQDAEALTAAACGPDLPQPAEAYDAPWLRALAVQRAVALAFLVAALAGMLLVSFVVDPDAIDRGEVWLSPTCPSKVVLGRPCLTCGMTRSFAAISHGQLAHAVHFNRGGPVVYVLTWATLAAGMLGLSRAVRDARRARGRRSSP